MIASQAVTIAAKFNLSLLSLSIFDLTCSTALPNSVASTVACVAVDIDFKCYFVCHIETIFLLFSFNICLVVLLVGFVAGLFYWIIQSIKYPTREKYYKKFGEMPKNIFID